MSVYKNDNVSFLDEALKSIQNQSYHPNEFIIVVDGPVNDEIKYSLIKFKESQNDIITKILWLKENQGLGIALNKGLEICSSDWIMRMDSDDISRENRIEIMIKEMTLDNFSHDVYGAYYEEFNQDTGEKFIRKVPLTFTAIKKEIGYRNPMNHVSVIIKRESLVSVGGYKSFIWFEDYFLWTRMILNNKKLKNFPIVTVNVRIGNDMFKRRRGIKYLNQEYKMQQFLWSKNLINFPLFIYNLIKRGSIRLLPVFLLKRLYKLERTSKR